MKPSNDNWVAFWFESNASFGHCRNREEWEVRRMCYISEHGSLDPRDAKMATYGKHISKCSDSQKINFGFRMEHSGDYTLADFARDNGMIL